MKRREVVLSAVLGLMHTVIWQRAVSPRVAPLPRTQSVIRVRALHLRHCDLLEQQDGVRVGRTFPWSTEPLGWLTQLQSRRGS